MHIRLRYATVADSTFINYNSPVPVLFVIAVSKVNWPISLNLQLDCVLVDTVKFMFQHDSMTETTITISSDVQRAKPWKKYLFCYICLPNEGVRPKLDKPTKSSKRLNRVSSVYSYFGDLRTRRPIPS